MVVFIFVSRLFGEYLVSFYFIVRLQLLELKFDTVFFTCMQICIYVQLYIWRCFCISMDVLWLLVLSCETTSIFFYSLLQRSILNKIHSFGFLFSMNFDSQFYRSIFLFANILTKYSIKRLSNLAEAFQNRFHPLKT